ncbi:portal protein [Burkholderia cenocepacia]|uniref:portal protein n=1 Tax=Burkholderia cenocepacia TaxID=95486 RepID=UPI002B245207|nr:hypothetical protein [Burkholderia cenocepacia]MEB2554056.1 hypothetical protein [Burkholderia cenocepacia]
MPNDKRGMTDEELLALIGQYEKSALGSSVSVGPSVGGSIKPGDQAMTTLEIDRYNALNAYFARPLGNEVEDRSQIVLPELRDTVEWIMPQLMRMFAAGKPCQFDPENPDDDDQAEIETEVVNHVFMKQNPGFFILHDFFKDALLLRNGYINTYWLKERKSSVERYSGLGEIEVAKMMQDAQSAGDEIEILEQKESQQIIFAPDGTPQPSIVFDINLRRTRKVGRICVECVPPEEMRISPEARHGLDESPFAEHERKVPRSDLIEMGFDPAEVARIEKSQPDWLDLIALARNEVTDQLSEDEPTDPASQLVTLRTVFIRVDYDGDGIAELRRVMVGGDKILDNDEVEEVSYSYCSPIRMPHRHVGISYYDLLYDLQVIKTTLFRQALDNLYLTNNQGYAVDWQNVNMSDMVTSRPGRIVRTTGAPANSILPLTTPSNMMSQIVPALEYCDLQREMRTGIGKDTMGVDADALQDVTKGGQLAAMSAAAMKVELVARLLAEGVKEVFSKIHRLLMRHQDKPMTLKLTNRWVDVNPGEWRERTQISVNVGLGSGNREEARANIMLLGQAQAQIAPFGLVGPKQAYETFKEMARLLGKENPTLYAMDPDSQEYQQMMAQKAQQPPQDPRLGAAQIKAESDKQIAGIRLQTEQIKADSERAQAQAELLHGAQQDQQDRDMQAAQINSQEWQTALKVIGQIVASQLKQDAMADAGAMVNKDMSEVQRGS